MIARNPAKVLTAIISGLLAGLGSMVALSVISPQLQYADALIVVLVVFTGGTNLFYMVLGDIYD